MKKRFFIISLFWVLAIAAFGAIVMLLWNFVVPGVLGLATINFWQALALFVLARIFFGGFPGRGAFPARRTDCGTSTPPESIYPQAGFQ